MCVCGWVERGEITNAKDDGPKLGQRLDGDLLAKVDLAGAAHEVVHELVVARGDGLPACAEDADGRVDVRARLAAADDLERERDDGRDDGQRLPPRAERVWHDNKTVQHLRIRQRVGLQFIGPRAATVGAANVLAGDHEVYGALEPGAGVEDGEGALEDGEDALADALHERGRAALRGGDLLERERLAVLAAHVVHDGGRDALAVRAARPHARVEHAAHRVEHVGGHRGRQRVARGELAHVRLDVPRVALARGRRRDELLHRRRRAAREVRPRAPVRADVRVARALARRHERRLRRHRVRRAVLEEQRPRRALQHAPALAAHDRAVALAPHRAHRVSAPSSPVTEDVVIFFICFWCCCSCSCSCS